jgi:hypothetical protein
MTYCVEIPITNIKDDTFFQKIWTETDHLTLESIKRNVKILSQKDLENLELKECLDVLDSWVC